jgi:hypothetical protein
VKSLASCYPQRQSELHQALSWFNAATRCTQGAIYLKGIFTPVEPVRLET